MHNAIYTISHYHTVYCISCYYSWLLLVHPVGLFARLTKSFIIMMTAPPACLSRHHTLFKWGAP